MFMFMFWLSLTAIICASLVIGMVLHAYCKHSTTVKMAELGYVQVPYEVRGSNDEGDYSYTELRWVPKENK